MKMRVRFERRTASMPPVSGWFYLLTTGGEIGANFVFWSFSLYARWGRGLK